MAAFDFKKEFPEFYLPARSPHLIEIPELPYLAVRGSGDPNAEGGEYKAAVGMLYAVAYTIKMSRLSGRAPEGYFDYVVPPLEGLWWTEDGRGADLTRKGDFHWLALIRLPDFVTRDVFEAAVTEAERKKGLDLSRVEYIRYADGLSVQCMHLGPYDAEPETLAAMERCASENGCVPDYAGRFHHELYLSDPRRCKPERLRTVIRIPVRRA